MMKYFPTRFTSLLLSADESNYYLTFGVIALFVGLFIFCQPLSLIVIGIIFIGLSYIMAQQEADNGPS